MILLFFTGCEQKEDNDIFVLENKSQTDIKRIKQQFEAVNLQDAFLKVAFKVKWNQYEIVDNSDGSLTYEFSTNLRSKLDLVSDGLVKSKNTKKIFSVYKLLAKESADGTVSFEILKFTGNNSKELNEISLSDLADFNGAINYSSPEGIFVKDEIYNYGSLIKTINQRPDSSLLAKAPEATTPGDVYIFVIIETWKDYYNYGSDSNGNFFFYYVGATRPTVTTKWVPISTGFVNNGRYHEHFDDPSYLGPHGGTKGIDTHLDEIKLTNEFKLSDKLNCTYNQLSKITGIQELLKGFTGKTDDKEAYHLNMDVLPNPNCPHDHANACTFGSFDPTEKDVTIKFDSDYINDPTIPTITIARTVIHEAIHAALFLEVKQWNAGVTPETPYKDLLDDYRKKKIGSSHPIMSANYVSTIAQTLKEVHKLLGEPQRFYDDLNSIEGFNWDEYYLFLAYEGLAGTPEYVEFRKNKTNEYLNKYSQDAKINANKNANCDKK
jgi:hypothetical protein